MTNKEHVDLVTRATASIIFDFDIEQCQKLDKACGIIHELLPEFFSESFLISIQGFNTKKLSKLS